MDQFFQVVGILTSIFIGLWLILRLLFGKNWLRKAGFNILAGPGLMASSKQLVKELKSRKVNDETITEVGVHVLWRFTRAGIVGLFVVALPTWLSIWVLTNQNSLIQYQNEKINTQTLLDSFQTIMVEQQTYLLEQQNEKFDLQNELFKDQNIKVTAQTDFLGEQTGLFRNQNQLLTSQNSKLDIQNDRLNLQNNLIEAERRGSLVILMSNILDQVNEEINEQKRDTSFVDSLGYALSDPLIGRIAALSQGFLPYRYLENDTLTEGASSPERGQLLLSLVKSELDSITYKKIYQATNFNSAYLDGADLREADLREADLFEADLRGANLSGANLSRANLSGANLSRANLRGADLSKAILFWTNLSGVDLIKANLIKAELLEVNLSGANLSGIKLSGTNFRGTNFHGTNFRGADLSGTDLSGTDLIKVNLIKADLSGADIELADLREADLRGTDLRGVRNLTIDQLKRAETLFECKNLDFELKQQLEKERPCLFTAKGCWGVRK